MFSSRPTQDIIIHKKKKTMRITNLLQLNPTKSVCKVGITPHLYQFILVLFLFDVKLQHAPSPHLSRSSRLPAQSMTIIKILLHLPSRSSRLPAQSVTTIRIHGQALIPCQKMNFSTTTRLIMISLLLRITRCNMLSYLPLLTT